MHHTAMHLFSKLSSHKYSITTNMCIFAYLNYDKDNFVNCYSKCMHWSIEILGNCDRLTLELVIWITPLTIYS